MRTHLIPRMMGCLLAGALLGATVAPSVIESAGASREPRLCREDTSRATVPENFALDACFDGSQLVVQNQTQFVFRLEPSGDIRMGLPEFSLQGVEPWLTSLAGNLDAAHSLLFPSQRITLPVGAGEATFSVVYDKPWTDRLMGARGLFMLLGLIPGNPIDVINAVTDFIEEVRQVTENRRLCKERASNALAGIGCDAGYAGNIGYAIARVSAKIGREFSPTILLDMALTLIDLGIHADVVVGDAIDLQSATGSLTIPAVNQPSDPAPSSPGGGSSSPPLEGPTGPAVTPTAPPFPADPHLAITDTCSTSGGMLRSTSSGFTPGGTATISVTQPSGQPYPDNRYDRTSRVSSTGSITWNWDCTGDPPGAWSTFAVDNASGARTPTVTFRIDAAPSTTTSTTPSAIPGADGHVLVVSNLVTNGSQMREDPNGPAVLQTETRPYCGSACTLAGTERNSGGTYERAVCQTQGQRITNGNDHDSVDDSNPGLYSSTLWYGVRLGDGRFGFVSEVWISPDQRGGLDLPGC